MNQLTWFLGILSIIQMAFLPGFILCRVLKLEQALPSKWALYFFLSLVANYLLVYVLTSLHIYNSVVLRSLVAIETLVAFRLSWEQLIKRPSWNISFPRFKAYWQMGLRQQCIGVLAVFILVAYAVKLVISQGQVFGYWDPTVSYNPWAIQWAGNAFPTQTWSYPQLLSTNWSISYVLIGQLNWGLALEFFPGSIMALFAMFILLLLWQKMLDEKNETYGLGLIITGLLVTDLLYPYIGLGYADIPVAAFGLAAVIVLFKPEFELKQILLGAALCGGAALTKQAGLWLIAIYPLLTYISFRDQVSSKKLFLSLGLQMLIMLILAVSWYGLIWQGAAKESLGWSYLTHGIYQQASVIERLQLLWQKTGLFFWLCLAIAVSYCWKKTSWRLPFLLIGLPIILIWALLFSYDNRNLSMSLPFIGMMAGAALSHMLQTSLVQRIVFNIKKFILSVSYLEWLLAILLSLIAMGWQADFRAADLNAYQIRAKQEIGYPDVNQMLYQYQQKVGFNGKILTAWTFLFNDLNLSQLIQPLSAQFYGCNMLPNVTENQAIFLQAVKAYPSVSYILVDNMQQLSSASFYQYLATMQQAGKLVKIGETPHFTLYKIIKPLN
ncbi:MAG: hypothetical protein K0R66_987 [Gammaproteobacteria bacterium]|jgi:hypothetical protein|nr:hypothetical protein [Gammaproteobacteria bacterium]